MKNSGKILYLSAFCVIGAAAVTLRTVAILTGFDFLRGFFEDKLLNTLSIALVISASLIALSFVLAKRSVSLSVSVGTPRDFIASAAVGISLIVMAFECAFIKRQPSPQGAVDLTKILPAPLALLAALGAMYFLLSTVKSRHTATSRGLFATLLSLFLTLYAVMLYFDTDLPINAPQKISDQMAYAFIAVFFIYEARAALKRPMPKMYIASGLIATVLSAYSALPALLAYLVHGAVISATLTEIALTISLFAYCLIRTVAALASEGSAESPTVSLIKAMAEERQAEIDAERASRAHIINNEENVSDEGDNYEIELPASIPQASEERVDS